MKTGVFTALLSGQPFDEVLKKLTSLDIHTVELGTGNYPGDAHCPLSLLEDKAAFQRFKDTLARHDVSISALSCHGNSLLGVSVVIDFSGCPGDSPQSKAPNWVTCPWPPEYLDLLNWQWNEVVIPYWTERAEFAANHGVKIAIEMHPGFVVYNPETLLRLRSSAGPSIGCNYDPSHMFWQSIDPVAAIRVLGDAVFHVHAKDTHIYSENLAKTGVLDTKPYTDERNRSWIFRTCGFGHDGLWWKEFVSTLRLFGYDGVLSIEHEDSLLSAEEGLRKAAQFLNEIIIREQPNAPWWA
jgi:sugar phosphate isomerase/epimerase